MDSGHYNLHHCIDTNYLVAALPTANAGQYATSHWKLLLCWLPC